MGMTLTGLNELTLLQAGSRPDELEGGHPAAATLCRMKPAG